MQNPPMPVIRKLKRYRVKIGKARALWGYLGQSGRQMQDLHSLGPPFPGRILARRNPDFLPGAKTFRVAFAVLAGRNFIAKDDNGVQNLNAAQHAIPALNKDPAMNRRRVDWGIDDPAPKGTIRGGDRWRGNEQPER